MTPQLQQAIKLLQLSRLELVNRIQEEMELNPLLDEMIEEEARPEPEPAPAVQQTIPEAEAPPKADGTQPEIDWEQYLARYDLTPLPDSPINRSDERPSFENFLAPETTLQDHLLWQLRLSNLQPEDQDIGSLLIGNIDEDGYLRVATEEVAELAKVSAERVEGVLRVIQDFDPVGVASRDLRECLLKQALEKNLEDVVILVIDRGMKYLESKNYRKIAKELDISFEDVVEAAREIASLEPRPGRNFSAARIDYIVPDVFVAKEGDEYTIRLNEDGLPRLRVSPYY
ncbi:MAG: RNA polymerase sigma-54 factor, partial [Deltaproteobacteria bacterium]|nr:RNA polymerase sigma-54 factor [Deltaproteobacteria bacterium]